MKIPPPPDHLRQWAGATEVWSRIVGRLQVRGEWLPIYAPMAALTAHQCSLYGELASRPELSGECEQARVLARRLLVEMQFLAPESEHVAAVDDSGRDADLTASLAPLVAA